MNRMGIEIKIIMIDKEHTIIIFINYMVLNSIILSNGTKINNNTKFQEWIKENKIVNITNNYNISSLGILLLIFSATKTSPVQSLYDENGYKWESKVTFNQLNNYGKYTRDNGSSYKFRIEKKKKIQAIKFRAIVKMDGSYIESKIVKNMDGSLINKQHFEKKLFDLAKKYIAEKKLGWKISPPHSWVSTSAHITLNNNSLNRSLIGKEVIVEIVTLKHYTFHPSRWIVLNGKVYTIDKQKLSCPYNDCHISIGQQKIKPITNKKTKKYKKNKSNV